VSELRDLAAALGAISKSLTSIEAHVAQQVADARQLRNGMHDLRNKLQMVLLEKSRTDRAVEQIEVWIGSFGAKLAETTANVGAVRARVEVLADEVTRGFREDRAAIGELQGHTQDETTQA
jgi:chromosome segregation ATPase